MRFRAQVATLLILVVVLAGCFRQAEEPIDRLESSQPISSTAAPTDPLPLVTESQPDVEPTSAGDAGDSGNAGEPAIQITVETSTPIAPTLVPQQTDLPPTDVPPVDPDADGEAGAGEPTPTLVIITPGVPSGPSAINTPTPVPLDPLEPTPTLPAELVTPTSPALQVPGECIYIVQPGDNLYRISVNNNTTVQALRDANPNIIGDLIQPGDEIVLPDCVPGDDADAAPDEAGEVIAPEPTSIPVTGAQTIHVVRSGETLFQIARQYTVSVDDIIAANELLDPNRLSVGQELVIPPAN